MSRTFSIALAWLVLVFRVQLHAEDKSYDEGFEPKPPCPFPSAYADYQILPGSISPNGQYALIYPKRSVLYETKRPRLILISLCPFRLLLDVARPRSLAGNSHGYYTVRWAEDSSAVLAVAGIKWGPEKVWLVPANRARAGRVTDLTAEIRKVVSPDFKKSKAPRYNDYFDFIFESEPTQSVVTGEPFAERGWDINAHAQVVIHCTCTTDPKEMDDPSWTVRFQGTWDIPTGRFIEKSFTRIQRGRQN